MSEVLTNDHSNQSSQLINQESPLLQLANSILATLQQEIIIDDEDYLFNDEFYIAIVTNIVPENSCNIIVGETVEEKTESLNQLIQFLSTIVEMDLRHINGRAIIEERDAASAKHLLELIFELIMIIKQEQGDEDEQDGDRGEIEEMSHVENNEEGNSLNHSDHVIEKEDNLRDDSENQKDNEEYGEIEELDNININDTPPEDIKEVNEDQLNQFEEQFGISDNFDFRENKSCPEIEIEPDNNSNSQINYKENYSENDLTRYEKVMAYLASGGEFFQNQQEEYDYIQESMNEKDNNDRTTSSKPAVNISKISEVSRSKENSEPHSHQKYLRQGTNTSKNMRNESNSITIKNTLSNNKLISQHDSYGPLKVSSVESKGNYESGLTHEVNEYSYGDRNESGEYEMVSINNNKMPNNFNKNQEEAAKKISNFNNANNNQYVNSAIKNNNKQDTKAVKDSNRSSNKSESLKDKSSHIKSQSKKPGNSQSNRSNLTNRTNKTNKSNNTNRIDESSNIKKYSIGGIEKYESSNYIDDVGPTNSNKLKMNKNSKSNNSNYQNNNQDERILKKIKSQKQLINKDKSKTHSIKSDISMSSVNQSFSKGGSNNKEQDLSENIIEELPLNDDNLKFEIMKEFRRLYGNKLDRILLKNNVQNSSNTFEIILRNIRLARQKLMKVGNPSTSPDDLITKEFILKYNKELEYIINYYQSEERKRKFFKDKAVSNLSKNVTIMQKINEIENRKIADEIERRKKSREIKNRHQEIKICNEIYSRALELEKQKYLEERANLMELRRNENAEKRSIMIQIENYYKDKISILKDILRKEKYEKEIEHRAKIQFLSKFEREKKKNFKKQIDEIFDRLDEEDRKQEFRNTNSEHLEKILMTYYKK